MGVARNRAAALSGSSLWCFLVVGDGQILGKRKWDPQYALGRSHPLVAVQASVVAQLVCQQLGVLKRTSFLLYFSPEREVIDFTRGRDHAQG